MANTLVQIPDGKYCSDKSRLGCKFDQNFGSTHYCLLYEKFLGKLEIIESEGSIVKTRQKCKECIKNLQNSNPDNSY